jgi:hypothetical protein
MSTNGDNGISSLSGESLEKLENRKEVLEDLADSTLPCAEVAQGFLEVLADNEQ